jgi:hypothetical protein
MKRIFEQSWREASRYLDEVLLLEADERPAWLEALRHREPAIANLIGSYLMELAELDRQCFLEPHEHPRE